MKPKYDALTAGADRLNALLGWWGAPIASGNGKMDGQMKLLQQLASDLQKTCRDADSGQMEGLFSSNDRLIHSCQELLHSRQPQEVMAAELDILATFLDSASLRARRWAELTQKLEEYCATLARDAAEELCQQAQETVLRRDRRSPNRAPSSRCANSRRTHK